jgi:peptidylprolyl isomerase
LGFYRSGTVARGIRETRLASTLPAAERPSFLVMKTGSASFAAFVTARANRRDDFFGVPAGGVDLCNAPVPVRRTPAPSPTR